MAILQKIIVVGVLATFAAAPVFAAENSREEGLQNSIIETIDIDTLNRVTGTLEATGSDSSISVGDVSINNVEGNSSITVDTNNEVGTIIARDGTVTVGNIDLYTVTSSGDITLTADNDAGGITAEDGGQVKVGNIKLENVSSSGTMKLTTLNDVGTINADNGIVSVGNVDLNKVQAQTVNVKTENTFGGVTSQNGSKVRLGSVSIN